MAEVSAASLEKSVRCPRCGYDQRGVVATWTEACPMEGVCTECGLQFRWATAFNPRLFQPSWCVEYGRWVTVPWRAVKTLVLSFWPWRFWWSLQMHHQPQWRRIAAYLVSILFIGYAILAGEIGAVAFRGWRAYDQHLNEQQQFWSTLTQARLMTFASKGHRPENYIAIDRVNVLQAVGHAVLFPWSSSPSGTTMFQDGSTSDYPFTPQEFLLKRFANVRGSLKSDSAVVFRVMLFPVIVAALMPVLFLLLPISRRTAKVRWQHIMRIVLYGLVWFLLALLVWIHQLSVMTRSVLYAASYHWGEVAFVAFLALPAALFVWWGTAISRYLKMRRPWLIALLLFMIAYLAPMLLGYFWLIAEQRPQWFIPSG